MQNKTTLSDLTAELREIDRELAPGSETHVWGNYLDRMRDVTGVDPLNADVAETAIVPDAEAEWWRNAYAILRANPNWTMDMIRDAVGTDRSVTCPQCCKVNKLAHEDGAVDGPRAYHAACWTAMSDDEQTAAWEEHEE